MKFSEAVKELEEGKKIRRAFWEEGMYIYIDGKTRLLLDEDGLGYIAIDVFDGTWEIYEEKEMEIKVGDRFRFNNDTEEDVEVLAILDSRYPYNIVVSYEDNRTELYPPESLQKYWTKI